MTTETLEPDLVESPPFPVQRFTLEEYRQLRDSNIVDDWPRFELLEGWIVPKMTKGPEHDLVLSLIQDWMSQNLPEGMKLRVQCAMEAVDSEPEPDVAVVRGPLTRFKERHPRGSEVVLLVEVAESSLAKDRRKSLIYAAAGVVEYWIVNLIDQQVEVFRNPLPGGTGYRDQHIATTDETLEVGLDDGGVWNVPVASLFVEG